MAQIDDIVGSHRSNVIVVIVLSYCLFYLGRAVYRIFLHPLSKYPGSKLAAASTEWYEWYWNIHQRGRLLFEIERLHKEHGEFDPGKFMPKGKGLVSLIGSGYIGPVVRIGVNELHINTPEFFQDITKVGSRFYKEPVFYRGISFPTSSIGLTDPHAHKIRRQVLNPLFTASRVQSIAPQLQSKIGQLCVRFDELSYANEPVNIHAAFKSVTMDIISEMIFGEPFDVMNSPGFSHPHLDALHDAVEKAWIFRTFPTLGWLSLNMPDIIASNLFPVPIIEFAKICRKRIDLYLTNRHMKENANSEILEQLLNPDAAPGHVVPSPYDLNEEALTLLTAGNDTTSHAMILGVWFILSNPSVHKQLVDELVTAFPSIAEEIVFEKVRELPYLTAVLKEILRCSNPLPGRLPRIVPPGGVRVNGNQIESGVIVHTSAYLLNRHESVWGSDSNEFIPERWLEKSSLAKDKYMTSFNKGSRQCLGMHLAWCELYLLMGTLFRRYEVQNHETTAADMAWCDQLLMLFEGKDLHVKLTPRTS